METYLQADLPLSAFLSLAGQFSQVHCPGGHVHSVPHLRYQLPPNGDLETYEQDDSFLSLEGQPAHEHSPGGQEHLSPHLLISSYPAYESQVQIIVAN